MREQIGKGVDLLAAIAVVAGIMMLVRPGSQGPVLVEQIGHAFISSIHGTVGFYAGQGSQPAPASSGVGSAPKSSGGGSSSSVPWWTPKVVPGIPFPIPSGLPFNV